MALLLGQRIERAELQVSTSVAPPAPPTAFECRCKCDTPAVENSVVLLAAGLCFAIWFFVLGLLAGRCCGVPYPGGGKAAGKGQWRLPSGRLAIDQ